MRLSAKRAGVVAKFTLGRCKRSLSSTGSYLVRGLKKMKPVSALAAVAVLLAAAPVLAQIVAP
uniref:hypothetical protein n=2 Tax=unclassified Brevundimonas TaxID=2622653 RepID=UPI00289D5811